MKIPFLAALLMAHGSACGVHQQESNVASIELPVSLMPELDLFTRFARAEGVKDFGVALSLSASAGFACSPSRLRELLTEYKLGYGVDFSPLLQDKRMSVKFQHFTISLENGRFGSRSHKIDSSRDSFSRPLERLRANGRISSADSVTTCEYWFRPIVGNDSLRHECICGFFNVSGRSGAIRSEAFVEVMDDEVHTANLVPDQIMIEWPKACYP